MMMHAIRNDRKSLPSPLPSILSTVDATPSLVKASEFSDSLGECPCPPPSLHHHHPPVDMGTIIIKFHDNESEMSSERASEKESGTDEGAEEDEEEEELPSSDRLNEARYA